MIVERGWWKTSLGDFNQFSIHLNLLPHIWGKLNYWVRHICESAKIAIKLLSTNSEDDLYFNKISSQTGIQLIIWYQGQLLGIRINYLVSGNSWLLITKALTRVSQSLLLEPWLLLLMLPLIVLFEMISPSTLTKSKTCCTLSVATSHSYDI